MYNDDTEPLKEISIDHEVSEDSETFPFKEKHESEDGPQHRNNAAIDLENGL